MVVIDADSGQTLYEKDANTSGKIASTTKILTALVVLRTCGLEETVQILPEYAGVEGSSMYLSAGEERTVRELLYGLLLASGNDAAVALACHAAGSVAEFSEMMNACAAELGCTGSHFENPHGLDSPEHYSTAADLARITAAAMRENAFAEIVSTMSGSVAGRSMSNHNRLLWQYDGAVGVKTGYTESSGRTLVTCARRNGLTLICVTLNDPDDWTDHTAVLDWVFSRYCQFTADPAELRRSVDVISGETDTVSVRPASYSRYLVDTESRIEQRYRLRRFVYAPVFAGEPAGTLEILADGEMIGTIPLVYEDTVEVRQTEAPSLWERLREMLGM